MAERERTANGASLPWPKHINAENFKAHSNFFVGQDETAILKGLLSIRTMVGVGMVVALFLQLSF